LQACQRDDCRRDAVEEDAQFLEHCLSIEEEV